MDDASPFVRSSTGFLSGGVENKKTDAMSLFHGNSAAAMKE